MAFFRTDDRVRIYYEEHGEGHPLVLAYGIGGNADLWDVNVPALAARHRLILWEPRGHARSDSPEDPAKYSFARWALDLKGLLDHLRLRKAHVGGLSLGGGIATRFTLRFPGRVRSLIVTNSSSAAGLPLPVEALLMRARSIEITLTKGMDAMAEFAMAANPNVAARLELDPAPAKSSTRTTGGSRPSATPTRCARSWPWTTSPTSCRRSAFPCSSSAATAIRRWAP